MSTAPAEVVPAEGPGPGGPIDPSGAGGPAPVRHDRDVAGLGRFRGSLFVLPAFILIGIFLVFPAIWTLYLGLLEYSLSGSSAAAPKFLGLGNYVSALSDPEFGRSLLRTLSFVGFSAVLGQNVLGFVIAWWSRGAAKWIRGVLTVLVLISWVLPSSVVAFLWQALLDREDGTLNHLLHTIGTAWTLDHPMIFIIVFNVWRGTAFSMLLYSSALNVVPTSHLEVARLAGASRAQQLRDVVLPHIKGHILTNSLLITLWTFNDFSPYLLTGGGPNNESQTLPVYIYKSALYGGHLGYGSALSLLLLLVNLVIAVVYIRALRRQPA